MFAGRIKVCFFNVQLVVSDLVVSCVVLTLEGFQPSGPKNELAVSLRRVSFALQQRAVKRMIW